MSEVPITPVGDLALKLRALKPGDTAILEDGVYKGGVYISKVSGTEAAHITLRARNKGKAIVRGGTSTRKDGLGLYQCKWWDIEGIVFEQALRAGLYLGDSDHANVTDVTCRDNNVQGLLAGGTSFLRVLRCRFLRSRDQHGAYVSGAVEEILFEDCVSMEHGQCNFQMNSQGMPDLLRKWVLRRCSGHDSGKLLKGAAVNLIGVAEGLIEDCLFERNLAGGISFSANGQVGGASTNNDVRGTRVTFLAGEGRSCIQQTGGGTLRVTDCIVQAGKTSVKAINAVAPSVIYQVRVTVLPVATTAPGA